MKLSEQAENEISELLENHYSYVDDSGDRVFYDNGVTEICKTYIERIAELEKQIQEKKYSEEDVIKFIHSWDNHINIHEEDKGSITSIKNYLQLPKNHPNHSHKLKLKRK